jgi:hypothetical protein
MGERWPPVYDFEGLKREIEQLQKQLAVGDEFYEWRRDRSTRVFSDACQGDIVSLADGVPVRDRDGLSGHENPSGHWMVIGNTCDFARTEVAWTQLVPITDLGPTTELRQDEYAAAMSYQKSREFFLPSWSAAVESNLHVADFVRPVTADKALFAGDTPEARVEARLGRAAWHLLNACLVRFLARDDGRYD